MYYLRVHHIAPWEYLALPEGDRAVARAIAWADAERTLEAREERD